MPGTLVVGFDGTDGARIALAHALALAGDLGAAVVVIFAFDPPRWGAETKDLDEAVAEHGRTVLERATHQAAAAGVEITTEIRAADPAPALIAAAEEHGARYIVVGSNGERPLKSALVGATPTRLLHLSATPIVVVPLGD
jgi:nucleotide-binding universal stress UspA family protein